LVNTIEGTKTCVLWELSGAHKFWVQNAEFLVLHLVYRV